MLALVKFNVKVQMNEERIKNEFGHWHNNVTINESEIGNKIQRGVYVQTEKSIHDLIKKRIKRSIPLDMIPGTELTF